jgi:two-component system, OmpR family, sensor histidine kinase ChvG
MSMRFLPAAFARLRTSRIGLRILAFNLLVVFLPVAGILYLDVYEAQLLETQERGMIQQARVLAASLGGRPVIEVGEVEALLARMGRESDARLRVFDATGALLADSGRVTGVVEDRAAASEYSKFEEGIRARALYRIGVWLTRARQVVAHGFRAILGSRSRELEGAEPSSASTPPEVREALRGGYGAATRPTPGQRSLTLHSSLPVRHGATVIGAVQVSQSTYRVLQALYVVRLRVFEIVLASLLAAAALSVLMSATIVRPLVRLRRTALAFADRRVLEPEGFRRVDRRDEIGDLARALDELTRRLDAHIRLLESFAADVSHEFKNPLASIRTSAEMIASAEDDGERTRFLTMLKRDVDRLERLVSGVREFAHIDGQIAHERPSKVDVGALVAQIAEGMRLAHPDGPSLSIVQPQRPAVVVAAPDRLAQVFENIVENARTLAPAGSTVDVVTSASDGVCRVTIADRGPGIPDAHLERVFDRFFSYRPDADTRREHTGLGLAIARAIVEGYGGAITAANRPGGGAIFEVRLPCR